MRYLYILTIGCQMNSADADLFHRLLAPMGFDLTDAPEKADLVLVNTCTIRAKAEDKAFSFLGRMQKIKARRPGFRIGVAGCVAQQEGTRIFSRLPHVDFVLGTHAIWRLPEMVEEVFSGKTGLADVDFSTDLPEDPVNPGETGARISDYVTIMRGCDNFCTYCVVPHVRGREMSRNPDSVVEEVRRRVQAGAREITLLGQNVNSYGKKEGLPDFPELLRRVSEVPGLLRLRFATSHPKDLSDELIEAHATIPNLCSYLHLPVQSGSTEILSRMNRRYTREHYLERIHRLREACPSISLGTDIIVGFPGETGKDFEDTLSLLADVRYDTVFAFAYSDRPNAEARNFPDKISGKEKRVRLAKLLHLQNRIARERNEACVGSMEEILVEGRSARSFEGLDVSTLAPAYRVTGRTSGNRVVHALVPETMPDPAGSCIRVRVDRALGHSLLATYV